MSERTLKPDLKLIVFDDMAVVGDPEAGRYFTFNRTAGVVLEALAQGSSPCDATKRLITAYGLPADVARGDVERLFGQLDKHGLLGRPAGHRGHVVFLQELQHLYPFGSSAKVNRWYMEQLVEAGFEVSVFCDVDTPVTRTMLGAMWARDTLTPAPNRFDDAVELCVNGVRLLALTDNDCPTVEQVARLDPDAIIVSEDRTFARHAVAAELGVPVLWLATRPATLPLGRHAWNHSLEAAELLRKADAIVVPNLFMAEYVRGWARREAQIVPSPPCTAPRDELPPVDGFVTLVNPSEIKGITLFLEVARRLPDRRFAAVPSWSTTEDDLRRLRSEPNVTILRPNRDVAAVLDRTAVLLVPSLWQESPGLLVSEAMLRSVPTVVSATGSLPEIKMGVEHTLWVNAIEEYTGLEDGRGVAVPVIPRQDDSIIERWTATVARLTSDRDHWEQVARASYAAAQRRLQEVAGSSLVEPVGALLQPAAAPVAAS
jgi:coenzyme PQQ synthesis protein D (PqqD)/glycosyl transferase family 1